MRTKTYQNILSDRIRYLSKYDYEKEGDGLLTADTCPICGKRQRWVCRRKKTGNTFRMVPAFLRCADYPKCSWTKKEEYHDLTEVSDLSWTRTRFWRFLRGQRESTILGCSSDTRCLPNV
jgi:ssDNA-binding Zn-finger/Zn-ribbon topoisomerase 1